MIDTKLIREMAQALKPATGTTPYDTEAEVVRVEGNTAWVHIPGGVDETPVDMTINARKGDKIRVRVSGGQAWILGNDSAPPTDDKAAKEANKKAIIAEEKAGKAQEDADEAQKVAINYITSDEDGLMIADLRDGKETPRTATGRNVLIDNDSVDIRDGQNVLASFGEVMQVGELGKSHVEIDYNSFKMVDMDGNAYAHISDLRNESEVTNMTYNTSLSASEAKTDWSLIMPAGTVKVNSVDGHNDDVVSFNTERTDDGLVLHFTVAVAVATINSVSVDYDGYPSSDREARAYTFGYRAVGEDIGFLSFAEGNNTIASQFGAHAEGNGSQATGNCAHAEGGLYEGQSDIRGGIASGDGSHAEGVMTTASGDYSHAEGYGSEATGAYSHAQNWGTKAAGTAQTVEGMYNVVDSQNTYGYILGNGYNNSSRSNAYAVTWDGDLHLAINPYAGSSTPEGKFYTALNALGWVSEVSV